MVGKIIDNSIKRLTANSVVIDREAWLKVCIASSQMGWSDATATCVEAPALVRKRPGCLSVLRQGMSHGPRAVLHPDRRQRQRNRSQEFSVESIQALLAQEPPQYDAVSDLVLCSLISQKHMLTSLRDF